MGGDVLRWYDKHGMTHRTWGTRDRVFERAWCVDGDIGLEVVGKWMPADTPITCLMCHRKEVTWPE